MGGGYKNFLIGQRVGQEKNCEGQSGHPNISSQKIFGADAAFLQSFQYHTNYLQTSVIGKYPSYEN